MRSFVLLGILFFFLTTSAFAQTDTVMPQITPTPTVQPTPEYRLPYPGLLPDSPLYFLKTMRDRMVGFLVSNTEKKAEFNLLQADKRLNSAVALFAKGKTKEPLAISTLSKAENYLEEAITNARDAKSQGIDISEISKKLVAATIAHEKSIVALQKRATGKSKSDLVVLQGRVQKYKKDATTLLPQEKSK